MSFKQEGSLYFQGLCVNYPLLFNYTNYITEITGSTGTMSILN